MERLPEFIANHLFLFSLLVALLMLLAWNLFGDSMSGVKTMSPAEVTRLINHDNAVVVDIRPAEEFKDGHIINAMNMPVADLESRRKELEKHKDKPVVLYCQGGAESGRVIRGFKHEGFGNLYVLKGGMQAWKSAGLPLTRD